jgi:hypothetical protein
MASKEAIQRAQVRYLERHKDEALERSKLYRREKRKDPEYRRRENEKRRLQRLQRIPGARSKILDDEQLEVKCRYIEVLWNAGKCPCGCEMIQDDGLRGYDINSDPGYENHYQTFGLLHTYGYQYEGQPYVQTKQE